MKVFSQVSKHQNLFLRAAIITAVLSLVLLAAGIANKDQLLPGTVFYSENASNQEEITETGVSVVAIDEYKIPILLIVLLVVLPFILFILIMIFAPKARKRAIRDFTIVILWAGLLFFINRLETSEQQEINEEGVSETVEKNLPTIQQVLAPLPEINTDSPNWLVYIIGFLVMLALLGVVYYLYRRSKTGEETEDADLLAAEASHTLDKIHSGADFRNAILRCYDQMCKILLNERGLNRQRWMTAREFERRLLQAGLPESPVEGLTQLFEYVRYGGNEPDKNQENQAVDCLSAIASFSRKAT
ncbi:MAG: DUF4129 domain-containing protein [Chloroflexota bacterium]|nr:DUF4129 domain-containing protein [Chloroflexota bacterium]